MSDPKPAQAQQEPCEKCGLRADAQWGSNLCPYCDHAMGVGEPALAQPVPDWREHAHTALHRLWTKAVGTPDYVKAEWQELEVALYNLSREAAHRAPEPHADPNCPAFKGLDPLAYHTCGLKRYGLEHQPKPESAPSELPVLPDYASKNALELLSDLGDDAHKWAKAFQQIIVEPGVTIDETLMLGWFANAIVTAQDVKSRERALSEPPAPNDGGGLDAIIIPPAEMERLMARRHRRSRALTLQLTVEGAKVEAPTVESADAVADLIVPHHRECRVFKGMSSECHCSKTATTTWAASLIQAYGEAVRQQAIREERERIAKALRADAEICQVLAESVDESVDDSAPPWSELLSGDAAFLNGWADRIEGGSL